MHDNQITNEVYFIEGMCGTVLDTAYNRADAIKEFILGYKERKVPARLVACINGIREVVHPTGTAADYQKKQPHYSSNHK